MRRVTTLEERTLIGELAQQGCTDREVAQRIGWSWAVVRKWRRRGQHHEALLRTRGRPTLGALGTFAPAMREALQAWRKAHPGWGPKTLRAQLETDEHFQAQRLPSQRSIARFLHVASLSRPYERHSPLPPTPAPLLRGVHEEWEMDARGYQRVPEVGMIALINLNDCYSHVHLLSYPCLVGEQRVTRHPTTEDYQIALRLAFSRWGLPERIAVDHESIFYDNLDKSPFPTRLHLWLLALDVPLRFGRLGRPTDQGLTERSHQLWYQQVLQEQTFATWDALYQALEQRRDFLNASLPCATLGEVAPLVAYPEAQQPRRPYRPEWEAEMLDPARIGAYLAQGHWFRWASNVGAVCLGNQRYGLGKAWIRQQVEITFDATTRELVFAATQGAKVARLPLKGVAPQDLMGELGPLVNLPRFQLALPMTWDEYRVIQLSGTLVSQLIDT